MEPDVEVLRVLLWEVDRRRSVGHDDLWEELRLEAVEILRPLFVVIGTDWQAD
jgi:hypothetical protein